VFIDHVELDHLVNPEFVHSDALLWDNHGIGGEHEGSSVEGSRFDVVSVLVLRTPVHYRKFAHIFLPWFFGCQQIDIKVQID
jgi:hypothetical protein